MSESLKKIQEYILYQEQWAKNSNFSTSGFDEVNEILKNLAPEDVDQTKDFCTQQLEKNKNSVYALYITGLLNIAQNTLDDGYILKLIDMFLESEKWKVAEYLSNKVLEYRSNLQALKRLTVVYENLGEREKIVPIWEQIVRLDYDEADMLLKLANNKKESGNTALAIKDYKKAIQRYLQHKNFIAIREIWNILLDYNAKDTDFYFTFINKIERILPLNRAAELFTLLYEKFAHDAEYDVVVNILKKLLRLEPSSEVHRANLVHAYQQKYKDNPKLEDCIRMSNISQSWRNIHEAISDFEKHISFFPGGFVHHSKWGIGRIQDANHQHLIIDFAKKRDHQMDIVMAVNSLESLPKDHFWVLKSIMSSAQLKQQIVKKPIWTLRKILTSLGGANVKTIRSELVPSMLTVGEWNSWSIKARKILQTSPHFGVLAERSDLFVFSESPITPIDKFYGSFKIEDSFLGKIQLVRKAIDSGIFQEIANDKDVFLNIVDYFNSFVNASANDDDYNEQFVNALFVCNEISTQIPSAEYHIHIHLRDFIPHMSIEHIKSSVKLLRINQYKQALFKYVREYHSNWKDIYQQIIPYYHTEDMISTLENEGEIEFLQSTYHFIQEHASDYKNAFIWFTIQLHERKWLVDITDDFRIFSDLIRIAILLYRDIQNKYQVPINRRLLNTIESFLFESERISTFIINNDTKSVVYLYSLINQISDVIPNRILELRDIISQHHPDFDFRDQFEFEQTGSTGFLTLTASYNEKKKQLQHIHDVEVPENSKEIEKARAFGDLKENAEYKAALEHQELLNTRVAQLKKEIEQARLFDESTFTPKYAGFSACIELFDHGDKSTKKYTLLGPWESDPKSNVISYLSPLGKKLYKKQLDEKFSYVINEKKYTVSVANISKGI